MLVSDLILQVFVELNVIGVGDSISSTLQADAFLRLNQLVASLSTEGASVFNQVMQTFNLQIGVSGYTLGSGGSFPTTGGLRAQKVTAWRASFGGQVEGGLPLSMPEFAAAASAKQKELGELNLQGVLSGQVASFPPTIGAPIPSVVGADTAYPLVNVHIFPAPLFQAGARGLAYWTPIAAFATVGDSISLPPGYERMLHYNLAVDLYPQYVREGGIDPALAALAQNAKASIIQENTHNSAQAAQQ